MDSIADMGGTLNWGRAPVPSPDEPLFAEPWEGRAFAMDVLTKGRISGRNLDAFRHALELAPPARGEPGVPHGGHLVDDGVFTWDEFRDHLVRRIADADPDGFSYYRCWPTALESIPVTTGRLSGGEVTARGDALLSRPAGHEH